MPKTKVDVMMAKRAPIQTLFLSLLLTSLHAHASKTEWHKIPKVPADPVSEQILEENKAPISRLGDGSELSRSLSELLGDEIWQNQSDISDALFKSIGDISIDFDILDDNDLKVKTEFKPRRKVFFYNPPLTQSLVNGNTVQTVSNDDYSRFYVINSLTNKLKVSVRGAKDVGGVKDAGLYINTDIGVQINHIQSVESPRNLESPISLKKEEAEKLNVAALTKSGFFSKVSKAAGKLFEIIENAANKTADRLTDLDESDVFFDKLLDAFRLPGKLPVNADMIKNKMKVGEIVTVALFAGGGPEISYSSGVISSGAQDFTRVGYYVSLRKIDENRVAVHPKIQFQKGWDVSPLAIDIGAEFKFLPLSPKLSITPFYWMIEGSRKYSIQTFLEYDLRDPHAAEALSDVVTFSFKKTSDLIHNGSPYAKVSHKTYEIAKQLKRKIRLNVGFSRLHRDRSRHVAKTMTLALDGTESFAWQGEAKVSNYFRFNLFKKNLERSRGSHTKIASPLDEDGLTESGDPDGADQLTLTNMTSFYNRNMKKKEVIKILEYIQNASGLDAVLPSQTMNQLDAFYNGNKSGKQAFVLITQLGSDVMKTILDLQTEEFWEIVAKTLLKNPNQSLIQISGEPTGLLNSSHRAKMRFKHTNSTWNMCETTNVFSMSSNSQVSCLRVWLLASNLGQSFEKVKRATNDEDRLRALTQVIARVGVSSLINKIFLDAYKLKTGKEPKVDYYIRFEPAPGISPYLFSTNDKLTRSMFHSKQVLGELVEISQNDRRIKDGVVYYDKSKSRDQLYVSIKTPVLLTPGQRLTLWLQDVRVGSDKPLIAAIVSEPAPVLVETNSEETIFRYDVELPPSFVDYIKQNKSLELQVRLENDKGQPLSEFGRFMIRMK